jgi:hypothetical protein
MYDDEPQSPRLQWYVQTLFDHCDLFACWVMVDAHRQPWALGLFDADFLSDTPYLYGRYEALITSPTLTLRELPARRGDFEDHGGTAWSQGLCLSVPHYSGLLVTFHQYQDGSGCVHLSVKDGCDGYPVDLRLPYDLIGEYLACTAIDPTRWHERPGWVRNPRPLRVHEANLAHYVQTGECLDYAADHAIRAAWFATITDELERRLRQAL